jgi:hypothetical protein
VKIAQGSARFLVPPPAIQTFRRQCPSCRGAGCLGGYFVGEIEQVTTCPHCDGRRVVDVDVPDYKRKLDGPCPDCAWRAAGKPERRETPRYDCGVCNGSRRVPLKVAT